MTETVQMRVGPLIGEQLLEIAQTHISKGDIEYGSTVFEKAFGEGFNKDLTIKVLKNQLVIVTDDDGFGVHLDDDSNLLKENTHNIFDWNLIMKERFNMLRLFVDSIHTNDKEFSKYYTGDIEDYSLINMMKRYYTDNQLNVMMGKANIAARIIGSFDGKICDKGSSNPTDVWEQLELLIENWPDNPDIANYERVLYHTVNHVKLIKNLINEYKNFEATYFFLADNGFINKFNMIEEDIEEIMYILKRFSDSGKGYYHPLCNEGLYNYKEWLFDEIMKTRCGNEYLKYGIIKKDIMDGYDAGWLSPEGDFYGGNGATSNMIHLNIAEQIFSGNGPVANVMFKDGVSSYGGSDSPDYWLESHGWMKIHHDEIYGSFIGDRNPSEDFPYPYCPTDTQIKMICDYADKYYKGKMYTCPQVVKSTDPISTYKLRQMDDIMLHEVFHI